MATKPRKRTSGVQRKKAETMLIPYEFVPGHRVVVADDVVVQTKVDQLATTIQLRFTRMDTMPSGEKASVERDGGSFRVGPAAEFTGTDPRKAVEVDVLLRPDHAFAIARAIIERLKSLNEEQRARYNMLEILRAEVPIEGAKEDT